MDEIDVIEKYVQLNLENVQNSEEVDILSSETIKKYAAENKLDIKPKEKKEDVNTYDETFENIYDKPVEAISEVN